MSRDTHTSVSPVHCMLFCAAPGTESADCEHGEVRLEEGPNIRQGRVEMCINNAFGSVCSVPSVDEDTAAVVCVSAGFSRDGEAQE